MLKLLIANGAPIKDIAQMWGISRTAIYRYLEKQK
ncbi:helix-turn-helix domain-containing protein [Bacillus sp. OTU530]